MTEKGKTKRELEEELRTAYEKIDELESAVSELKLRLEDETKGFLFRPPRRDINANIEFITDFDIIEARGINISTGGLCFDVREELPFEMQFDLKNKLHRYRAHLVWMKRLSDGGYRFGFMFIPPERNPSV